MNRNLMSVGFFMVLGSLLLTMAFSSKIAAQPEGKTVYEGPFNGDWETTVTGKGKKFLMGLQQSRTTVTGRYQSVDGRFSGTILGTVTNNVLRFTWVEPSGAHGAGRLTLSSDGRSFQGTFSTTDNPDDTSGGTWNGTTTRLNKPGSEGQPGQDPTGKMGKMTEAEFQKKLAEYEERQKNAPATQPAPTAASAPKPPFIAAGQPYSAPYMPYGIVYLGWDGGPDHPNVEVFVSMDNSAEIPAFSMEHASQSPVWKQPKVAAISLQLQRYHHYRFVLKAAGKTLSTAAFVVP